MGETAPIIAARLALKLVDTEEELASARNRIAELTAALIEIDNEMRGAHDGGCVLPVQVILRRVLKKEPKL